MEKKKTNPKKIKQIFGKTLKDAKDKTVLVEINLLKINPIYKKRYFSSRKMLVHTDKAVKAGQNVLIEQCRPISRHKAWKIIEVKK